jgi:glycosyltransferase involved in cell wall biosynthesis
MTAVSAVMTAFNAAPTIGRAIAAILAQTHDDLEIVVVDDGSTDSTLDVVTSFGDARIVVVRSAHVGRPAAFNLAVESATGPYIAVCDADDASLPRRFSQQATFLDTHADVDVVSGNLLAHDARHWWSLRYPTSHDEIVAELDQGRMPIAHPAAMFRKSWFVEGGGLDPSFERAEDFELYHRLRGTTVFAALDEPLIEYDFRTLRFGQWRSDARFHGRALGHAEASGATSLIGYAKYRAAVATQRRGWQLTRRSRDAS